MQPLSPHEAILQPFRSDYLPAPVHNAPLFLPADAQRLWYLGFVENWTDFQSRAIALWTTNEDVRGAFDKIKGYDVSRPQDTDATVTKDSQGPAKLEHHFRREVLEVVECVYNELLRTATVQKASVFPQSTIKFPKGVSLANADSLSNECDPKFVVRAIQAGGDEETRVLGHAEFLGGRPGALTWAVEEISRDTWGSLRCVLGDIAQWMLIERISYAFLTSSDEIMFLRFNIDTRTEYVNIAPKGEAPMFDHVDAVIEPRLYYSDPIKHSDALDEANGKIPVKLGVLYLLHTAMGLFWQLPEEMGNSLNYAKKTNAGEN
ncbi:hypothetical protein EJ02DRAFT_450129 [Clathrospora elynae]|uniref:Uncharacterized protein n=1 Tax=Clathrospora elynae TaxID=706981 RepID=A0A6A5T2G2_9PLEO|nr:hypothetical protein EJ02DRAFT_450129 [Clathrospora elynae]